MSRKTGLLIFTHLREYSGFMKSIANHMGLNWDGNNNILAETDKVICNIQVLCTFMNKEIAEHINKTEDSISAYMLGFETEGMDDLKGNLMHYITGSNTFVSVNITEKEGIDDEEYFDHFFDDMNYKFDDILKEVGGGVISFLNATMFFDEDGDTIIEHDGDSELEEYFPFEYEAMPDTVEGLTIRQIARRNDSMKFLFDNKIYCVELPVNDDDEIVKLRTPLEIANRALGLLLVSLYSECRLDPEQNKTAGEALEFIKGVAKNFEIEDIKTVMSPCEYDYVNKENSDENEQVNFSWKYENLYVLEWALGLTEWNMPVDICDVGECVKIMNQFDSAQDIADKCHMLSKKEILDKADLIYRMDWACVDARIHGLEGPVGLEHGVTQERHTTLNWLISFDDADWDDVDTPT